MNVSWLDLFPIVLFFIALFGLIVSDNIVKSIIMTILMQTAVITFWIGLGARFGTAPPIFDEADVITDYYAVADPLPQALMLTAIIIGIAVTAINITMLNALFRKYKTVEWEKMQAAAADEQQQQLSVEEL